MLLTEDQKFFLTILRETSCVRADHVFPLLHLQFPDKTQYQADAMLRTLRYQGKVVPGEDNIIRLAERRSAPPCGNVLLGLDILLALQPKRLLQLSASREPYPLCFLIQRKDEWIDHFALLPVPPGRESYVSQILQAEAVNYTFLLYLDALDQHRRLILHRDHYFVVEQEGRLRFFKGGEARR